MECAGEPGRSPGRLKGVGGIGLRARILRDPGVISIRRRAGNPGAYLGLSGFSIEIAAVEPVDG